MKTIYQLELHEESRTPQGIYVLRVAGGWVYAFANKTSCFVPFDNEFQESELN